MKIQTHCSPVKTIVNNSKGQLTTPENSLLNKGLNFATTIKWIPYLDLIAPIEEAALKIPKARADELRWTVRKTVEKSKTPKPNFTKTKSLAIKPLQDDDNNIILPVGEGNATVVMDRVEYFNKLEGLIGDYSKVKKDPTLKTERKLSQILSSNKDLIPQIKYRQLTQNYSTLPHIYDLPKVHKDGIPLRLIVSNRGSACHPLSRFLMEIICPTNKSSSYVKNSAYFVERISNASIHSNQMFSLDVVSLFTKVPTDETLAVLRDKLAANHSLKERTFIPTDNDRVNSKNCIIFNN